ncbi:MAG: ABC transporter ATP-binding protein [Phocaeicola sp.]
MKPAAVITAHDLTIGYRTGKGENRVHENLSFQLFPGELTCLLGANGTGKSTLLRTLSATQPALAGELLIGDKPLATLTEKERSRTIGVVLTDKTQAGGLTVYELVALGRQPHTGFFGRLSKQDHLVIEESLTAVGIAHKATSYTAELSDGERQKVMIAKALVQECPLILLDEPTAFLDVVSRIEIMTLLHKLAITQQKAILLSTHDIEQALVLSDKLWLLSKEQGLVCGVTEDLILNHRMEALFKHPHIRFDYNHGVFYPEVTCQQEITIWAANELLQHWSMNALNRHNYACLPQKAESNHLPHLVVNSAQDIYLTWQHITHRYNSFEELLVALPLLLPIQ